MVSKRLVLLAGFTLTVLWVAASNVFGGVFDYGATYSISPTTAVASYTLSNQSGGTAPNLTTFTIANFYSSSYPIFSSLPVGWSGTALSTGVFSYTVVFAADSSAAYIRPGSSLGTFTVECTKPNGAPDWGGQNVPFTGLFDDGSASIKPFGFAFLSIIPEPTTFGLTSLGALGLWILRRRRR